MSEAAAAQSKGTDRPGLSATSERCKLLLFGHDTIECSYYAVPRADCQIDFDQLSAVREGLRLDKEREPREVTLGDVAFLLQPFGTNSGYPFVLSNQDMTVNCGPNNSPAFFVKYHSGALWRNGIGPLHTRFVKWLTAVGFEIEKPETVARVDFAFDYWLPRVDFDEDSFVSLATKDAQYRSCGAIQTFDFGRGDIKLRVYDKVAEIHEQSSKTWFFELWGAQENVWRIEWQVRKELLRGFAIRSLDTLESQQGDLLRYLADEHDSLRVPTTDSNRSRWPRHELWVDLQSQIANLPAIGVYRDTSASTRLDERLEHIAISMYGYYKQVAAIAALREDRKHIGFQGAMRRVVMRMNHLYDALEWESDVDRRIAKLRHAPQ